MQYKKYPGIDLAGQESWQKFDWRNITFPGKKDGKRSGRVEFQGRCVRHLNLESHSLPMSWCKECCSLTSADQGGLQDLWGKYQRQIFRPSGSQREATPSVAVSDNKDHVGGYAVARWPFLILSPLFFLFFFHRPIFAGLESKFGLIFPKTTVINNPDGPWVYISVCKPLL